MSRIAPHVAAAIAAGRGGTQVQAKPAATPAARAPHVAAAIAAGLGRSPIQARPAAAPPVRAPHVAAAMATGSGPSATPAIQRSTSTTSTRAPPGWYGRVPYLLGISKDLFEKGKGGKPTGKGWKTTPVRIGGLMEVQSALYDDEEMVVSANTTGVIDSSEFRTMVNESSYAVGTHNFGTGTGQKALSTVTKNTESLDYHAEQVLVWDLAKRLKKGDRPKHVVIAGYKRPCSRCRRVLIAFRNALLKHYKGVEIHFADRTGQDTTTAVHQVSLDDLKPVGTGLTGEPKKFAAFIADYQTNLERENKRLRYPDEKAVKSGDRMKVGPKGRHMKGRTIPDPKTD